MASSRPDRCIKTIKSYIVSAQLLFIFRTANLFEGLLFTSHSMISDMRLVDWTVSSTDSCKSHMDIHTFEKHRKHMVKLIGLTWQQPQWCQSNPPLKPWWHHHAGESVWESWGHMPMENLRKCVSMSVQYVYTTGQKLGSKIRFVHKKFIVSLVQFATK